MLRGRQPFASAALSAEDSALISLGINPENFAQIQTLALKRKLLDYKLVQLEFDRIKNLEGDELAQGLALQQADHNYEFVLQSHYFTGHPDRYSNYSQGLNRLRTHNAYCASQAPLDPKAEEEKLKASMDVIGSKKSGVEPGFIAILTQDYLLHVFQKFPDRQQRRNYIRSINADLDTVFKTNQSELPKYMVKLAYQGISKDGKVSPDVRDLGRSSTMQQLEKNLIPLGYKIAVHIYKAAKTKQSRDINTEAVLEALANDVARVFGMQVQEQELYPAQYSNEVSQLLLLGKWLNNATDLGRDMQALAGGDFNNHYLVTPVLQPSEREGIRYLSDHSIPYLAEHLPLFLLQGDRDGIGSKAQNKMRVGNTLVGIDFGKAYQDDVIDRVGSDFRLPDSANKTFKNYSIFYDAPRSEMMRGLIKLARLHGCQLNPDMLKSYGEAFYQTIMAMQPDSDSRVFDDYIAFFGKLQQDFRGSDAVSVENRESCDLIVTRVEQVREIAMRAATKLIDKFKHYLLLESAAVDLLENVEKLLACHLVNNTSLRSPDGSVLLHHLRVKQNLISQWDVKVDQEGHYLFTASLDGVASAVKACEWLKGWTNQVSMAVNQNKIEMRVPRQQLTAVCDIFSEQKIKQRFHAEDNTLYQRYMLENAVLASLDADFSRYGVVPVLRRCENAYHVELEFGEQPDPVMLVVLSKSFFVTNKNGNFEFGVPLDSLSGVPGLIKGLVVEVESEKNDRIIVNEFTTMLMARVKDGKLPVDYAWVDCHHGKFKLMVTTSDTVFNAQLQKFQDIFKTFGKLDVDNMIGMFDFVIAGYFQHLEDEQTRIRKERETLLKNLDVMIKAAERQARDEAAQQHLAAQEMLKAEKEAAEREQLRRKAEDLSGAVSGLKAELRNLIDCLSERSRIKRVVKSMMFAYEKLDQNDSLVVQSKCDNFLKLQDGKLIDSIQEIRTVLDTRRRHIVDGDLNKDRFYDTELAHLDRAVSMCEVVMMLKPGGQQRVQLTVR